MKKYKYRELVPYEYALELAAQPNTWWRTGDEPGDVNVSLEELLHDDLENSIGYNGEILWDTTLPKTAEICVGHHPTFDVSEALAHLYEGYDELPEFDAALLLAAQAAVDAVAESASYLAEDECYTVDIAAMLTEVIARWTKEGE